jgi:K+ transporter
MLKNEEIVQKLPPLYAMTFIMLFSSVILTVLGLVVYGSQGGFTLDFNEHTGAFGFLGGGP